MVPVEPVYEEDRLLGWMSCNACERVIYDPNGQLTFLDFVPPCCGRRDFRAVWPSTSWNPLLALQRLNVASNEDDARSGCLFLAASLEALTEATVWTLLGTLKTPPVVALALIERTRGRKEILELFKKLTGRAVKQIFESKPTVLSTHGSEAQLAPTLINFGAWFSDWELLVKERNQLAHGKWGPTTPRPLTELVSTVLQGALPAMAVLQNAGLNAIYLREAARATAQREHQAAMSAASSETESEGD